MTVLKPGTKHYRARHAGSTLAIFAAFGMLLVGLLGIGIYSGFQAYGQNEIQKVAMTAAQVGASVAWVVDPATGTPRSNGPVNAIVAATTSDIISNSPTLAGLSPVFNSAVDTNGVVTVTGTGQLPMPFLTPFGISSITFNATATARGLVQDPVQSQNLAVEMAPENWTDIQSYSKTLRLGMALTDNPDGFGPDIVVQPPTAAWNVRNETGVWIGPGRQRYILEACSATTCYDLGPGVTNPGSAQFDAAENAWYISGRAVVDLERVNVRKADRLRFTHSNEPTPRGWTPGPCGLMGAGAGTATDMTTIIPLNWLAPNVNPEDPSQPGYAPLPVNAATCGWDAEIVEITSDVITTGSEAVKACGGEPKLDPVTGQPMVDPVTGLPLTFAKDEPMYHLAGEPIVDANGNPVDANGDGVQDTYVGGEPLRYQAGQTMTACDGSTVTETTPAVDANGYKIYTVGGNMPNYTSSQYGIPDCSQRATDCFVSGPTGNYVDKSGKAFRPNGLPVDGTVNGKAVASNGLVIEGQDNGVDWAIDPLTRLRVDAATGTAIRPHPVTFRPGDGARIMLYNVSAACAAAGSQCSNAPTPLGLARPQ